jgi:hypothetical protein
MSDAGTFDPSRRSRPRQVLGAATGGLLLIALGYAVARNRDDFVTSWQRIGFRGFSLGLVLGIANATFTWLQWRTILGGLGVRLGTRVSARVFFISQLGKYVPGSVWPLVLQAESARRHGAGRKAVVAGNLVVIVVSLVTGLAMAAVLLPFSVPSALDRFWWVLAALPLLFAALHPSSVPAGIDFLLTRVGRQPLGVRLAARTTLRGMGWSALAWIAIGAQTTLLAQALGAHGFDLLALSTGGIALAVSAGILLIPAPAGAGAREVVLAYVLGTVMSGGAALAVVVASRVLSMLTDACVAAIGLGISHVGWSSNSSAATGRHEPPSSA